MHHFIDNKKVKNTKKKSYIHMDEQKYNSKKESQRTIRVAHLNVKGLTRDNADSIGRMFKDTDVLALREIHVPENETRRLKIPGFNIIDYKGHAKH